MPELPEVETTRRGLIRVLEGRRILRAHVARPDLRLPLPERLAERLAGRRVLGLDRRGKFLLLRLDDEQTLLLHLGMSGRLAVLEGAGRPPRDRHDHLVLETEEGAEIRFNDARRFGLVDLVPASELMRHDGLAGLGPEPLDPGFDGPALARRLAGRRTPLKAALLDQRVVAGLGNIYVCEALYWAGLSPRRGAYTVAGLRAARLAAAIRRVLEEAIAAGGSTLRDYRRPDGALGYFQASFAVYDRAGSPCPRCAPGAACRVRRVVQGGRSTYYCGEWQS